MRANPRYCICTVTKREATAAPLPEAHLNHIEVSPLRHEGRRRLTGLNLGNEAVAPGSQNMLNKIPQSGRMARMEALVCHRTGKPMSWLDPHATSSVDARYRHTQAASSIPGQ